MIELALLMAVSGLLAGVLSGLFGVGGGVILVPVLDYRIAWALVRGAVFLFWNFPLQRDYVYGRRYEGKPDLPRAVAQPSPMQPSPVQPSPVRRTAG